MFYLNLLSWGIVTTGLHSWKQCLFLGNFFGQIFGQGKKRKVCNVQIDFFQKTGFKLAHAMRGNKNLQLAYLERKLKQVTKLYEESYFLKLRTTWTFSKILLPDRMMSLSLYDSQNSEMKNCDNMKLTCWKST
jgi:hypothetical protein